MEKILIPDTILIYETEGENLVPFINDGKSYGYRYYVTKYDPADTSMGYFNHNKEFQKYHSLDEYEKEERELMESKCLKLKETIASKDYYLKTSPLADEFSIIWKNYCLALHEKKGKKFDKSEEKLRYLRFCKEHSQLFSGFDIRFSSVMSKDVESIDDKTGEIIKTSTLYGCKPEADYEDYLKMIDTVIEFKLSNDYIKEDVDEIKDDYHSFLEVGKKLLTEHQRVGLLVPSFWNREVYIPKHMDNKETIKIDDFSLSDFLKANDDTIYWFKN